MLINILKHMRIIEEFKKFAVQGNMIEMAVGIIIGASFSTMVKSLVDDIIMPMVGRLSGGVDFSDKFFVLGEGEFASVAAAKAAGVATLNYGLFINTILAFLIVSWVLFVVIKATNRLKAKQTAVESHTKTCDYCLSVVPKAATRCAHCTSQFDV